MAGGGGRVAASAAVCLKLLAGAAHGEWRLWIYISGDKGQG